MLGGKGALEGRTVCGGALGLLNWDLPPEQWGRPGGTPGPGPGEHLGARTQFPHHTTPDPPPQGAPQPPTAQWDPNTTLWLEVALRPWHGGGVTMVWGGSPDDTGHPPDPGSLLPDAQPPCCPPQAAPQPPAMTSYRQELEKYRDIDEDKILRELSAEELEQLDMELLEMDPEVGPGAGGKRDGCHPAIGVPHG